MAALSWMADALKSAESSTVTSRNQSEKGVLVTDFEEESLIEKGLAGFVTSVTSVTRKKQGVQKIAAERKRFFSANDPTPDLTPHYGWLIHFTDREPVYVTYSPEATHAEVLRGYPAAVAAEPVAEPEDLDDRVICRLCENFTYSGICTGARPGGTVSAQKGYRPAGADMPQRCNGFESKPLKGAPHD